jgi:hypothetical protein
VPHDQDNPNPRPRSPPRGSPQDLLLRAAFDGNLRLVKSTDRPLPFSDTSCSGVDFGFDYDLGVADRSVFAEIVRELGGDEGRAAEKVRALRDSNGVGALHVAAARGKLPVCKYLVEELRLDVNSISEGGAPLSRIGCCNILEWSDRVAYDGLMLACF